MSQLTVNIINCEFEHKGLLPNGFFKLTCKNCGEDFPQGSPLRAKDTIRTCRLNKSLHKVNKPLNFTKALFKFIAVSIWKKELQYVNGSQYKERLELCDKCVHRHPDKPACGVCNCKIEGIFNKAQLKTELCPLGKWPILYDSNSVQVSK